MWRFLALIIAVSLLTLSSCATGGSGEEKEIISVERERAAMELLSLDMFSSLSFSIYEEYVPSFDDLENKYLSDVADAAVEAVKNYMPVIKESALELAKEPLDYIKGDTSLTNALRSKVGGELSSVIYSTLQDKSSDLEESFLGVSKIFGEIRKGYASLESVGKGEYLPEAESILFDIVSVVVSDEFFNQLGREEKTLKNTPASSDSPYSVFWE